MSDSGTTLALTNVLTQPPEAPPGPARLASYALTVNQLLHPGGVTAYLYPIVGVTLSPVIDLTAATPSAYSDCSGWVNYVLDSLAPIHEAEVNAEKSLNYFNLGTIAAYNSQTGQPTTIVDNETIQPWARADVLQYFFGNDTSAANGFQQITNFASLQTGDLIAYSTGIYTDLNTGAAAGTNPTLAATGDTGHTMVVVGAPTVLAASAVGGTGLSPNAVTIYEVPVVDDSSVPHLNDDRSYVVPANPPNLPSYVSPSLLIGGGVGTGTLSFAADANGNIIQLRFNTPDPWFPNNLNPTNGSNAAISFSAARLTPSITLTGTLAVNVFPNAVSTISGISYVQDETLSGSGAFVQDETLSGSSALEVYGGGVLTLSGANSYSGGTVIDQGTTVSVVGPSAAGTGAITFAANADATLQVMSGVPTNTIGGLTKGDVIDLASLTYSANSGSVTVSGNSLIVSNGSVTQTLTLATNSIGMGFTLAGDTSGGTTLSVTCFAAGTLITTADGPVPVEALRVGDLLPTLIGKVAAPIMWIGRRHVDCSRHPEPQRVWPVRIAAGAFGNGLPERNLLLSRDHAVFVDGVLIPVKYLVNGSTIVQLRAERVTYYHVELAQHDVVCAEGLPVETYLDTGDRASFESGGAIVRLHPDFATRMWEAAGCAELVVTGPRLEAVAQRLAGLVRCRKPASSCDADDWAGQSMAA